VGGPTNKFQKRLAAKYLIICLKVPEKTLSKYMIDREEHLGIKSLKAQICHLNLGNCTLPGSLPICWWG